MFFGCRDARFQRVDGFIARFVNFFDFRFEFLILFFFRCTDFFFQAFCTIVDIVDTSDSYRLE